MGIYRKIFVGCLVDFLLDYVWFSDRCFGVVLKPKEDYKVDKDNYFNQKYITQILLNFLMILVSAYLFKLLDLKNFKDCIFFVILITIGFTGRSALAHMLWEMKSLKYFLARFAYPFASLSIFSYIYTNID